MTSTNIKPQEQFNLFERDGQIVIGINVEAIISEDAQVRKLSAQLEELEYGRLYKAYSDKGRKSAVDAKVMFKIISAFLFFTTRNFSLKISNKPKTVPDKSDSLLM